MQLYIITRAGGAAGHSMVFAKPFPFTGCLPKPMTPNHLVATNAVEDSGAQTCLVEACGKSSLSPRPCAYPS